MRHYLTIQKFIFKRAGIALLGFFTIACAKQQQTNSNTIVCGEIAGINIDSSNARNLILSYLTYGIETTLYSKIDSSGLFRFEIKQEHPINMRLQYGKNSTSLYLEPGDSIYIQDPTSSSFANAIITGSNQAFNSNYQQFQKILPNFFQEHLHSIDSVSKISSKALTEYVKSAVHKNKVFVDTHASEYGWSNKFSKWALNELTYEITYDLTFYEGEKHSTFYDYYDYFRIDNPSAIGNYAYWDFLQGYLVYLFNIKNENHKDSISLSKFFWNITENVTGSGRDHLLALAYVWGTESNLFTNEELVAESSDYIKRVKTKQIRNYLTNYYKRTIGLAKGKEQLNIKTIEADNQLDTIFKYFSEKNIYCKVWAGWCAPCIASMPDFLNLKEEYENIEFVLIAINSNRSQTDKILSNFGITANSYYLDDKISEEIKREFNIQALPHYIIINRAGEVIEQHAPPPDSPKLKEILKNLK